ncbi:CheR family methyltransferase [Umezawaea tangerina]|uniref:protein-glutamate O-methyltransferase n=1 Tax=Umezawaea tangerina TaxID=84725 RepID=A0A2T0T566_9PSEU|nr:CheR family methyltransferase [Umezawaea tangerina]PRY40779.1 two-component system CheB/CheR fusion protein [Umezawaea tangerina]
MTDRTAEPLDAFENVLAHLKESRGFDFTGYKRASLVRRVQHRMSQVSVTDYAEYVDFLELNADEFDALFNTILINVTAFFRDPDAWDLLRDETIPALLAERDPDDPIRVWCAGCASGEEAYSVAILLAEALGPEGFRRRVKIYATDVDEVALARARHATYTGRELEGVPEALRERYFEVQDDGRSSFRKDLRRAVIFGRNDLVQDAPISRIDLLTCRNTLMYFTQETQSRILGRFHFALVPRGVLFLGKAEMLLGHTRVFDAVDLRRRVFRRAENGAPGGSHLVARSSAQDRRVDIGGLDRLRELGFSASPVAQVVVTGDDVVALVNHRAETTFGLSAKDVGRPLRDLDLSYRPVELRGYVDQARLERRTLRVKDVEWDRGPGGTTWFEVHVSPLVDSGNGILGVSIAFHDVSAARGLLVELEQANTRLESAYDELQSTNEELETTNEELQSTVEELETTNEELQSTNEELETTNDGLRAANDVLRERGGELDRLNGFLESVLTSLRAGVVVLDTGMRVLAWNTGAEELWGVRRGEAEGTHLLDLDIGLPLPEVGAVARKALEDGGFTAEVELAAVNRKGREVRVRVVCSSLRSSGGEVGGAILVMEQVG